MPPRLPIGYKHETPPFTEADLSIVAEVLATDPELETTAFLVRHVEASLPGYPIESLDALVELAARGTVPAGSCMVTLGDVQEHLTAESFPIESRTQLVQQVLFALMRAHPDKHPGVDVVTQALADLQRG